MEDAKNKDLNKDLPTQDAFNDLEKISKEKDEKDLGKPEEKAPEKPKEESKSEAKKGKTKVKVFASERRNPSNIDEILVDIKAVEPDGSTIFFQDDKGNSHYIKVDSYAGPIDDAGEVLEDHFGEILFAIYPNGWKFEIEKITFLV
jgi:hypothetical protein